MVCRDLLQARQPDHRRRRQKTVRPPEKGLLRRRHRGAGRLAPRLRLRARPRHRQDVLLRRLDRPLRRVRRGDRENHHPRGVRRHHRPRLYPQGARDPQGPSARGATTSSGSTRTTGPTPSSASRCSASPSSRGSNEFKIDADLLKNIVTKKKELPARGEVTDLIVSLITLKYTQSNSVCFAADGQAIGVGAGQQSRIHCTRLAGTKADLWHLRQSDKVLGLQFAEGIGRPPDKNNIIDIYLSDECEDVLGDGVWKQYFAVRPEPFTKEETARLPLQDHGRVPGQRRVLPLLGQHRARAQERRLVHRAAGRLRPRRPRHRARATSTAW